MNPILKKIADLRSQLTRWILVRGFGRWLLAALLLLVADMLLDRVFKMDFAQRAVMLVLLAAGMAIYFFLQVVRPLFLRPTDDALIFEVERKNPQLKESLISALQLSRDDARAKTGQSGVSQQLIDMTVKQGFDDAAKVNFGQALDLRQSKWNLALLAVGLGVAGLLIVGTASNSFLKTWFSRNILLSNDQWPQATYLKIAGVSDGKLRIPRGADHRQLVNVLETSTNSDVSISLEVDNPAGRSILPMKRTGKEDGREHLFLFHNVSSEFRFRATGGDATTQWVSVELVEPPSIVKLDLSTTPPAYTGIPSIELTGPGPYSVLSGSKLNIDLTTNKPISTAALVNGQRLMPLKSVKDDETFSAIIPHDGELAGGEYAFRLTDKDGVNNSRKSKFTITIKEDKPPIVRATLLGISGLVVPKATIPVSMQAKDEYGLAKLSFQSDWKTETDADQPAKKGNRSISIAESGQPGILVAPLAEINEVVPLELETLDLSPGTSFRFTVDAKDHFPTADNVGKSPEFLLRVVTEAELRSDLLRREIEQRQAFDRVYQDQLTLATELQALVARKRPDAMDDSQFLAAQEKEFITAVRNQKSIGTAVSRVADRFEEFLVEVKNNKLDAAENAIDPSQRIETRFDQRIIQPIRQLDENEISLAARHVEHCRTLLNNPSDLNAAATKADETHQLILEQMKLILASMNDSENFQGIINDIIAVKNASEDINRKIDTGAKPAIDEIDEDKIFD
jgi:hypothetical protein